MKTALPDTVVQDQAEKLWHFVRDGRGTRDTFLRAKGFSKREQLRICEASVAYGKRLALERAQERERALAAAATVMHAVPA